jgi:hypothetical protein
MSEIRELVIGAGLALGGSVVGAAISYYLSIRLRNSEKWKLFQEELGVIKSALVAIKDTRDVAAALAAHQSTLKTLTSVMCRTRPYMICYKRRAALGRLMETYRAADKHHGFAPRGTDAPSPSESIGYLIGILNEMETL